ncbi:truncated TraD [Escherichia coli]|nr:truncated TraD [Escherichia coli]SQN29798.1 truncated TraD [Escherichia coli]
MFQPPCLFLIPVFPRLFHHFCRWLLQFVQKLLRSFSHRLKGDTVRPAGIAIGVNQAGTDTTQYELKSNHIGHDLQLLCKRKLTAVCSHQTRIGNLDAHLI